ncbi:glycosyltransferase family 4 protein [Pseudactinotalea sp. Z1732]|uniref:glycosyltransferase family 4 protein n=1 Tax=Pseudactinotalea sp. Z1732 TaxID=3413026 RepID=UPI003C797FB6
MRVLHAIRSGAFAGVERHVAGLARAQARAGHDVAIIGGRQQSMRAEVVGHAVRLWPGETTLEVVRRLRRAAPGADIVHVHMTAAEIAVTLAAVGRRHFPPVVTTRHFARTRGSGVGKALRAALASRRLSAQISVSGYVAEHVDGASVVVYPGIPSGPEIRPARDREAVVLIAQRLEAEKRTDLGVRAFAASGLARAGWSLQIAGDGSQRTALEDMVSNLGLTSQVQFLGHLDDVPGRMASAGMLLAPCAIEGLGLSVLEAMVHGLPVVAAGSGGHRELLSGLDPLGLYPPTDPRAAGESLAALAADPARRDAYAAAARSAQRERFNPAAQSRATEDVYRSVLHGSSPSPELVVISLEAWDEIWRRNQYLLAELVRADPGLRVLFVEPPADPLFQLSRRRLPRWGAGLRPLQGATDDQRGGGVLLFQPTKVLPRRIDRHADQRLAKAVQRASHRAGFRSPMLWLNDPAASAMITSTPWPSLYDITDDWLAADRDAAEHERLVASEQILLARCEEVTVCSAHLARTKGEQRPVTLITNAVDLDRYRRPQPRPDDLPAGPVALYLGTVHPDRFDVPLATRTARAVGKSATLVLVGPIVDISAAERSRLEQAGVVVLGGRPWRSVPAYLQHADVLLVPHLVNEFTDSLDPIKFYEYRAVGRPIVATPVAVFRDSEDPLITAVDAHHFPQAVARLLGRQHPPADPPADPPAGVPTWRDQAILMGEVIARLRRHGATSQ